MLNFFKNLSIKHKLFLGFGSIMVILSISTAISYQKVEALKKNTHEIIKNTFALHNQVSDWRQNIQKNMIRDETLMMVKQDTDIMDSLKKDMSVTSNDISHLQENISKYSLTPEEKTQFDKISTFRSDYKSERATAIDKKVELVASNNVTDQQELTSLMKKVSEKREKYIQSVIDFENLIVSNIDAQQRLLQHDLNSFQMLFFSLTTVTILFGSLFAYFVSKNLLSSINKSLKLAQEIKNGNLTHFIDSHSKDELGQLVTTLNDMSSGLREMLLEIKDNGVQVDKVSNEIAQGNLELSSRTESQAAALEEAAASLEEFTGTLGTTSEHAMNTEEMTKELSFTANKSGEMMKNVIKVMDTIQSSSKQIVEIVSLIDTIAFQTNLLALNAAVEAARAGEHGKGFAVVAGEVRQLSQKTATASKDIKSLISTSANEVKTGVDLVNKTGQDLEKLLSRISEMTNFMSQINTALKEQKLGINQINEAVAHIDGITQENANLASNNSESSELLKMQSKHLKHLIERFKYE